MTDSPAATKASRGIKSVRFGRVARQNRCPVTVPRSPHPASSLRRSTGGVQRVIPLPMPVSATDGEVFHLPVGDLDADRVGTVVEFSGHAQARCRGGGADEAQDRLVAGQGSALPVPGDLGKQAVLDFVPFAGAWR